MYKFKIQSLQSKMCEMTGLFYGSQIQVCYSMKINKCVKYGVPSQGCEKQT